MAGVEGEKSVLNKYNISKTIEIQKNMIYDNIAPLSSFYLSCLSTKTFFILHKKIHERKITDKTSV